MTFREELADYAASAQARIDESPQMDEQNTKRKLIEPLIDRLGWDILSSEVELEYSVQMGSGTKKVDYALKLEDTPVVFVEAKGCDTDLQQRHRDQLGSYMRQVGVEWGILANGRHAEIYRRDYNSEKPNEIQFGSFATEDTPEHETLLQALTRGNIASGESRQIAEKIDAVHSAIRSLQDNKDTLAADVTSVVTEVTGQSVSQQVEAEAKSFVDDLIETLESQATRTETLRTPEPTPATESPTDSRYGIRLHRDGETVHEVVGDQQATTMGDLVTYLIEQEGLLDAIDLPYVPGTGRGSRALLNHDPVHTNGTDMRQYEPVGDGYYLFTSLSSDDKQRYLSELPAEVGLGCEFVGEW